MTNLLICEHNITVGGDIAVSQAEALSDDMFSDKCSCEDKVYESLYGRYARRSGSRCDGCFCISDADEKMYGTKNQKTGRSCDSQCRRHDVTKQKSTQSGAFLLMRNSELRKETSCRSFD